MISVVIPVSNDLRFADLVSSLDSAGLKHYKSSVRIILAMNHPTDEVVSLGKILQQQFPPGLIEVVTSSEKGIAIAKNIALKEYLASSTYFVFLDSDCTVEKTYLDRLVSLLKNPKETPLAIRGYVKFISENNTLVSRLNCSLRQASYDLNKQAFLSPNLVFSVEVFKKIGLYRTDMRFGEDLEFGQRAAIVAQPVFEQGLKIIHRDDPRFISKTLVTMWGYGRDRGFRILRRVKMGQMSLFKMIASILTVQPYWLEPTFFQVAFCLLYLTISRTAALIYVFSNWNVDSRHFLYQTFSNGSQQKIPDLPLIADLP